MVQYRVVFKKEYTIDEKDEISTVHEAADKLKRGFAQQLFSVPDFFDIDIQKQPVNEIIITKKDIIEFINTYKDVELTEKEIEAFISHLESDKEQWMVDNIRCFFDEKDPRYEKVR